MKYDKRQATHEFTRWSESYDRSILQWLLFGPSHRALIQRIRNRFGDHPLKILDVGCGSGVLESRIREALPRAEVWGVDLVRGMLDKGSATAGQHATNVTPIQGDSERLPFASGAFDVITCANSFHHYPHQDRAVAEMHRVLRPGGRLLLIDGYRRPTVGLVSFMTLCVAGVEGAVHHASAKRFRELVSAAGFRETVQKLHHGPAPFLLTDAVARPSAGPEPHEKAAATPHSRPHRRPRTNITEA